MFVGSLTAHPALYHRLLGCIPSSNVVHGIGLVLVLILVEPVLVFSSLPLSSSSVGQSRRAFVASLLLQKDPFLLVFLTTMAILLSVTGSVAVKSCARKLFLLTRCICPIKVDCILYWGRANH